MQKIPFTKELREQYKKSYDPEKILQEVEKEIEEKGFSIFQVDKQKRLEFFYHFSEKYFLKKGSHSSQLALIVIIILLAFVIIDSGGYINLLILSPIFIFMLSLLISSIFSDKKYEIKKIQSNIFLQKSRGVKDKYILVTKKHALINNHLYKLTQGSFKKSKIINKRLFTKSNILYKESYGGELNEMYEKLNKWNHISSKISRLESNLHNFEESFNQIEIVQKDIQVSLINIKNGSFDFSNTHNNIEQLQKLLQKAFSQQQISQDLLHRLNYKISIDFSKFETYIKNKLIFSLKSMKYIVSNHLFVIDYQNNSTKNLDSEHIQLANARLKTYKTQLEQQVTLLEKQIEKLERKK